ncbi:hypothetical protein C5U62_18635 [Pseudomonas protegens]|uniref:Uncharacterized protein n=1 Tax=Pseudomonas protegens TaxID=380021 RepID=A0A2T6GII6_9PSED|nr:hypothetical protein C5U62_18635 [Pseudomonas protegens]
MWRGSLLLPGRAAALDSATVISLAKPMLRLGGCWAVEREQAPLPQKRDRAVFTISSPMAATD